MSFTHPSASVLIYDKDVIVRNNASSSIVKSDLTSSQYTGYRCGSSLPGTVTPTLPCVSFCGGKHLLRYKVTCRTQIGKYLNFSFISHHICFPVISSYHRL
ncbi:hypothetical protein DPMN_166644 [Dreissena polymorpha]|uniref:Uncharacterized protein n=1 Tax=Dreissena polymorpha TaxID=45954 RepID=A0A9D4EXE4_DREPO|nr:hypothetical protein DPMN_166644 [Dreissena polymorpha]